MKSSDRKFFCHWQQVNLFCLKRGIKQVLRTRQNTIGIKKVGHKISNIQNMYFVIIFKVFKNDILKSQIVRDLTERENRT